MTASDDDDNASEHVEAEAVGLCFADAFDALPRLTRAVFLLHRIDRLSYDDVGWRCGMSVDEVTLRLADALSAMRRHEDKATSLIGRIRAAWTPWRTIWMRHRRDRRDRQLGITDRKQG